MEPARPLREVFDEVARGDLGAGPAETLADSGHGDLPDQLVSEAVVSYADTAPIEVAEHLAPFVMVHSAVPTGNAEAAGGAAGQGLELLATAPELVVSDDETHGVADGDAELPEPATPPVSGELYADALDFGFGSGANGDRAGAVPSIEDEVGVPVEPGAADELPQPAETGVEGAYPWIAPPEPESADEPEDGDPIS